MPDFSNLYHNLPIRIDPTLTVGFFSIRWYSIMYLVAFAVVYGLLVFRLGKKEWNLEKEKIIDLMIFLIFGLLVGGRLGFILFYNPEYYFKNPLAMISPFGVEGDFVGISGMSYHGGLVGVILAGIFFARKNKINFLELADFVVPAVSAGYFFGRIGNFLNGELYGKVTQSSLGMSFGNGPFRHPSQLYEAFFEGFVLFAILWGLRKKSKFPGLLLLIYILGYATFRFFVEFYREPDRQIDFWGNYFSLGQIFSVLMVLFSVIAFFVLKRKSASRLWYNKESEDLILEQNEKNKTEKRTGQSEKN